MTEQAIDRAVTRWWLIRHAPVINPDRLIYGQRDVAADTGNTANFTALAAVLPADAVWLCTPLQRTRVTAAAIAAQWPADRPPPPAPLVEPELIEQSFGDWQGLSHEQLAARRDGQAHRFWLAPALERPPGGENFAAVVARVGAALVRQSAALAGRDIIAVCHGGAIRAALSVALGLDPERALSFRVDTLSLTRIDHLAAGPALPPAWRVSATNLPPGSRLPD